jgi:hypothetical protein
MSTALIRAGVADAQSLADELVRRSGLAELQRRIAVQFTHRGSQLAAAMALRTLETVLRERPLAGDDALWAGVERLRLASDAVVELGLLARSRSSDGPLPPELRDEGERLLGGDGPDAAARLGLPAEASPDELRSAALEALTRWQHAGADPLARRATADAIDGILRALEALLADLDELRSVVEAAQPAAGRTGEEQDERDHDEARLRH